MNRLFRLVPFLLLALAAPAFAHDAPLPVATIEHQAGTFDRNANAGGVLHDVVAGVNGLDGKWFAKGLTTLTQIAGRAHGGGSDQADANSRIAKIEIWRWHDANGNGEADPGDAMVDEDADEWVPVVEHEPASASGNAVAWDGNVGDLLQGQTIGLGSATSYLLLIRVISISDASNLEGTGSVGDGNENWDDGNGAGSGIPSDRYLKHDGTRGGSPVIQDDDVVWIYVPKN